jgi:hypothetical protein
MGSGSIARGGWLLLAGVLAFAPVFALRSSSGPRIWR